MGARKSFQEEIPPSRINITFKPATGGATKEKEIALKLMVLGDFTAGREKEDELAAREPITVKSKRDLDDVLKAQNPELSMTVPNRLVEGDDTDIDVKLSIASLKDFTPDAIVQQIPELQKMMEVRELLKGLKAKMGVKQFRRELSNIVKDPKQVEAIMDELNRVAPLPDVLGPSTESHEES